MKQHDYIMLQPVAYTGYKHLQLEEVCTLTDTPIDAPDMVPFGAVRTGEVYLCEYGNFSFGHDTILRDRV